MSICWNVEQIMKIAKGYQSACVLAAAAELDIFHILHAGERTAAEIAEEMATDIRATKTLLDSLAAIDLLIKRDDKFSLADGVADVLTAKGSRCMLDMVRHQANCLRRWSQLAATVKTGRPAEYMPSIRGPEQDQTAFIIAMDNLARETAPLLVSEFGAQQVKHLLDIGGASGSYTIALLKAAPAARATLFDLPEVIPLARQRIVEAGLSDRVRLVEGDFYRDELPAGADLALLSAIVHQNSRVQNRELFIKINEALADCGQLIIRDVIMDESRIRPPAGALFAINMLVATEGGGTYTFGELKEDLSTAGYTDVQLIRQDDWMNSLIRAVKKDSKA
ncbi:MAG: polyketide synthesis methyltransferase [Phycisphaerales bacterium]|nr:polyketide synthesis methyltransferase [Phycisphaerales bacterium]